MPRNPRHDILFEPIRIGPRSLKNRFYQVPYSTGFGDGKLRSQAAQRAMRAEGGWAAVCTDFASISAETDDTPNMSATMWDDSDVAGFSLVTGEIHRHGALAGIELHHAGARAYRRDSRWPAVAPSQIARTSFPDTPK